MKPGNRAALIHAAALLFWIVFVVALLALFVSCAPVVRCRQVAVPMAWEDGTVTTWTMTVCR